MIERGRGRALALTFRPYRFEGLAPEGSCYNSARPKPLAKALEMVRLHLFMFWRCCF